MPAYTPAARKSPLVQAWEKYSRSEEYENDLKWAADAAHAQGSMWSAFAAGYLAANPEGAQPPKPKDLSAIN